jgi:hypothetical protein
MMPSTSKHLIESVGLFLSIALVIIPSAFANGPLLPLALNEILPRIDVGMTREQVVSLLAEKYPAVKAKQGVWSGQSGYMDFILDERYEIDVSAVNTPPGSSPTVNKDFIIYIFDQSVKQRIEIKQYHWQ